MDLSAQIAEAITAWLRTATTQLVGPTLQAVGQVLFQTPTLGAMPGVAGIWATVRNLADGLFVLAFVAVGVLVMTAGGYDARYTAKVLLPRIAFSAVVANASLAICGGLVDLNNALILGLLGGQSGGLLFGSFAALVVEGAAAGTLVAVLVGLAAAVLAVVLLAVSIARGLLLVLLICLGPLALATWALPQTEDLAHLWWRAFSAVLFVQVFQAAVLAISLTFVVGTPWLPGGTAFGLGLLLVVVLYLVYRLPFAALRWAVELPAGGGRPLQTVLSVARRSGR
ncbi:MAG: hypothetical protein NVSMB8_06460 [Candidatus Limnocylindrales bacterium]